MVLTIGHSNRMIEAFVEMLQGHGVQRLVDIRTIPRSRHNPQFNHDVLPKALSRAGIGHMSVPALGGLRRARPDSVNIGWRNASFRGFADYMQTPEFQAALDKLLEVARAEQTAIMCAEAVPWRCHRSLVADALVVSGTPVEHIMSADRAEAHKLTSFAAVEGIRITYPGLSGTLAM